MADMTPEELAALFHGPEATTGPEAKSKCLVCGKQAGGYDLLLGGIDTISTGYCSQCASQRRSAQAAASRASEDKRRQAHFTPEQLAADQESKARQSQLNDARDRWSKAQKDREHREKLEQYHDWAAQDEARVAQINQGKRTQPPPPWGQLAAPPVIPAVAEPAELTKARALATGREQGFWIGLALGAIVGGLLFTWQSRQRRAAL